METEVPTEVPEGGVFAVAPEAFLSSFALCRPSFSFCLSLLYHSVSYK